MTWTHKGQPVFRTSPDNAWPLTRESDGGAKRQDAEERLDPKDDSAVTRSGIRPKLRSIK